MEMKSSKNATESLKELQKTEIRKMFLKCLDVIRKKIETLDGVDLTKAVGSMQQNISIEILTILKYAYKQLHLTVQ